MHRILLVVVLLLGTGLAYSEEKSSDTQEYLNMVQSLRELPIENQIEGWNQFLKTHPDSKYKGEIEVNVRNLEDLLANTDPAQMKEKKDTDRYLKAVEYSKKLSPQDQILLWEQFISENPQSIYKREAKKNLEEVRSKTPLKPSKPGVAPPPAPLKGASEQRVAPDLLYKDKQTAILLAIVPGIVVPGMAHWYTKDYMTAGILTGLRVAGLGVGIPGLVQGDRVTFLVGSILVLFSYMADIADAPFAVDRYNENLEKQKGISLNSKNVFELTASFSF